MADERDRDADRRWAAEHAAALVAQARAEALEEARVRLRARLVDALLDAAQGLTARPGAGTPPAEARDVRAPAPARERREEPTPADVLVPPTAPAARESEPAVGLWLYGVMPGDVEDPPALTGVDGRHRVELLRHEGLAALVSAVPLDVFGERALHESLEDLARLESLARGHEQVLEHALRLGALVPFRLCTIYEQADSLREMLQRERHALSATLQRLAGMAEWGVKGFLEAEDGERAETADVAASGTEYLSRKRRDREAAEAAREAVEAGVEHIHARLSEQAVAAVVSRPHDQRLTGREDEMVLNASYLVPGDRAEEFHALVDEIADGEAPAGLELELTGPWPAYHFVEVGQEP